MAGSLSNEERQKLGKACERLSQLLNYGDNKINQLTEYVEKLEKLLKKQEELTASARRDYEGL